MENSFSGERRRRLWRLDSLNGKLYLLLLSEELPDLTGLCAQFGTGAAPETRRYEPLLERVTPGSCWQFRLTANPTRTRKDPAVQRYRSICLRQRFLLLGIFYLYQPAFVTHTISIALCRCGGWCRGFRFTAIISSFVFSYVKCTQIISPILYDNYSIPFSLLSFSFAASTFIFERRIVIRISNTNGNHKYIT